MAASHGPLPRTTTGRWAAAVCAESARLALTALALAFLAAPQYAQAQSNTVTVEFTKSGNGGSVVITWTDAGTCAAGYRAYYSFPGVPNVAPVAVTDSDDSDGNQVTTTLSSIVTDLHVGVYCGTNTSGRLLGRVLMDKDMSGTSTNNTATGLAVTGTAQVGQTLTAATSGITDTQGVTSASYSYQWIRVATGGTETNVGTDSSTYTVVTDDVGKTLKVRVEFTDDDSNPERLTSAATAAVTAAAAPVVSIAAYTGRERVPEAADVDFVLTRTGATTATLAVTVAVSESGDHLPATEEGDKTATFQIGDSEARLTLNTEPDDTVWEPHSTVTATVKAAQDGGYTVSTNAGSDDVSVVDDDLPEMTITLDLGTMPLAEDAGAVGTLVYETARDEQPHGDITLGFSPTDGTATEGDDYTVASDFTLRPGLFRLVLGESTPVWRFTIPSYPGAWVTVIDDALDEAEEPLRAGGGGPRHAAVRGDAPGDPDGADRRRR